MADLDIGDGSLPTSDTIQKITCVSLAHLIGALFDNGFATGFLRLREFWNDLKATSVNKQSTFGAVKADSILVLVQSMPIAFSVFVSANESGILIDRLKRIGCLPIVLQVEFGSLSADRLWSVHVHCPVDDIK